MLAFELKRGGVVPDSEACIELTLILRSQIVAIGTHQHAIGVAAEPARIVGTAGGYLARRRWRRAFEYVAVVLFRHQTDR